jgi:uncharacterized membrane protein YphA (DoxX/SURF4 family)
MTPAPIAILLRSRWFPVAASALLTLPYWWSGLSKLADWQGALGEARHFGLEPAAAVAVLTILVQLGGSAALISGRWAWLGAGALGVFTLLATLVAHGFWDAADPAENAAQMRIFLEHMGLIGGLAVAAAMREQDR